MPLMMVSPVSALLATVKVGSSRWNLHEGVTRNVRACDACGACMCACVMHVAHACARV